LNCVEAEFTEEWFEADSLTCLNSYSDFVVSGTKDGSVYMWSVNTGFIVVSFDKYTSYIWAVAI
jgi:WD40 repeat protein